MEALLQECPNGVSFDPMAVRLLRQKVTLGNGQIEELKAEMFQLGNGLWFSKEMISSHETRYAFRQHAAKWLMEYGYFSVERLFEEFHDGLRHIFTPEECAVFLRHLGFTVAVRGKSCLLCFQPPINLDERLAATSQMIAEYLEASDGTLASNEIEKLTPHVTPEALEIIREQFLQDVHATEIGGVPCWRSAEAILLPEDFSEKLTTIVDTLVALDEKVSAKNLEFSLNLLYRTHFRNEHALTDNHAFMRVCAKYYQGRNDVLSSGAKSKVSNRTAAVPGRRIRGAVTRFGNIGVPVGAELVLTNDRRITCTVLDDSNHVECDGKSWTISALAGHLLALSAVNGYTVFSYQGETLWDRRLRLEGHSKHNVGPSANAPSPTEKHESQSEIIGLGGRPLSAATWRAFQNAGTNPQVAIWAHRVENGESIESIAREIGYSPSTITVQIGNRMRYFKTCAINRILPDRGAYV